MYHTQLNSCKYITVQHNAVQQGTARLQFSRVQHSKAQYLTVQYDHTLHQPSKSASWCAAKWVTWPSPSQADDEVYTRAVCVRVGDVRWRPYKAVERHGERWCVCVFSPHQWKQRWRARGCWGGMLVPLQPLSPARLPHNPRTLHVPSSAQPRPPTTTTTSTSCSSFQLPHPLHHHHHHPVSAAAGTSAFRPLAKSQQQ